MSRAVKFLIGLAAVIVMTWLAHGPLGGGETFVDGLERQARSAVAGTNVAGVEVRMGRDPLTRHATLSGPADQFQREGQGSLKGINDLVGEIPGMAGVHWTDEESGGRAMPLLLELLAATLLSFLIGVGLAALFGRRRERDGFY